jgi:fumarate reductase flavoprotein subunit
VAARDVDVLVIGSGAAGLTAALAASEAGARRILVAEAEGEVGGSSRLSGGIMVGAGTRCQKELGVDDNADRLYFELMQINQWQLGHGLARVLADHSGPTIDWLADLGVDFAPMLIPDADQTVARSHIVSGGGQGLIEALRRRCDERGIDIALGRRVERLLTDEQEVSGVAVGDDEITANAVVIATGGFASDPQKLARFYPDASGTEWAWYIGADGSRGDAIDFTAPLGAHFTGTNRGLRLLHANFVNTLEVMLPGWVILVNRAGRRFVNELAPHGILDRCAREQGDVVYAIFDDASLSQSSGAVSPNFNPVMIEEMVDKGRVARADSVDDLARRLELPVVALVGTIARFNSGVDAGKDSEFLKEPDVLKPISKAPFYAVELRPATICLTSYGLALDVEARVLREDGTVIPGLFAAGECTGVLGPCYLGNGNSLASCVTFGRIAGTNAASAGAS